MCLFWGHVGRLCTDSQSVSEDWVTGRGSRAGRTLMGVMLMSSEPINKPSLPFPSPHLWSLLVCWIFLHVDKVISAWLPQDTKAGWMLSLKPYFKSQLASFSQRFRYLLCLNSSITVMTLRPLIWKEMTCKSGPRGLKRFWIREALNPTEPGAVQTFPPEWHIFLYFLQEYNL